MGDDFQFPEPEPEAEQTPAPVPRQRSPLVLPWMVAGLAVVTLGVVSLYAKKLIDDQSARAYQAMRMADEYAARANKLEADQKDARRQAITSSEKNDEARAASARLTEQVADKDSALTHLKERHRQLVTDLRTAVRSTKGKALSKRIDRILARDAAVERAEAPQALTSQSPDAGPRRR
jgi:thioesterase domain-containing protein